MKLPRVFKRISGHKREKGQALVEFSLSLAVLAFLLLGVIEFGMLLYSYIVVIDATDEAASYAALIPFERDLNAGCLPPCRLDNDDAIIQRVFDTSAGNAIIETSRFVSITITPDYLERDPCTQVRVYTEYHHNFMTSLFGPGVDLQYEVTKMIVPQGSLGFCLSD